MSVRRPRQRPWTHRVVRGLVLSMPHQSAGKIVQEACRILNMPLDDRRCNHTITVQVAIDMEKHFTEIAGRTIVAHGDLMQTNLVTCRRILVALLSTAVDAVDRLTSSVIIAEAE